MKKTGKIICIASILILASCSNEQEGGSKAGAVHGAKNQVVESKSPLEQLSASGENGEDKFQEPIAPSSVDEIDSSVEASEVEEALADEPLEEDFSDDDSYYEPPNKVSLVSDDSSGVIRWEAPEGIDYNEATVVIAAAGGDTVTRKFSAGEAIELYGDLPDGVYNWETVITPTVNDSVRKEMQAVRVLGDMQAEKELLARLRQEGSLPTLEQAEENRQSGAFIVQDGKVRPSLVDDPGTGEGNGG